jgi:flagellar hook-basal body complex protein FliE
LIPPVSALPSLPSLSGPSAIGSSAGGAGGAGAAGGAGSAGGGSFDNAISSALDNLQQVQSTASNDAVQAAAGQGNIADAMIASTQASVATQVTTAVTNKAIDAFTQVMNMQV